jgi:predicted RNA-binding protein with RPS1 domain
MSNGGFCDTIHDFLKFVALSTLKEGLVDISVLERSCCKAGFAEIKLIADWLRSI